MVRDETIGAKIGAAVDAAAAKIDKERSRLVGSLDRINAEIAELTQKLSAKKSERSTMESQIAHTERERQRSILDALKAEGIEIKTGKRGERSLIGGALAEVNVSNKAKALDALKTAGGTDVPTRRITKALGAKASAVLAALAQEGKAKRSGTGPGAKWTLQ